MIAGLARQVAHALAVLENQHPIAVKAADDRAGRRGAERSLGDAGLLNQRGRQRPAKLAGQVLPGEHRRRLERVELVARLGADRYDLLEVQFRVDKQIDDRVGRLHRDLLVPRRESLGFDREVIGAGLHTIELEPAVCAGERLPPVLLDDHFRPNHGFARHRMEDLALDDGACLRRRADLRGSECEKEQQGGTDEDSSHVDRLSV